MESKAAVQEEEIDMETNPVYRHTVLWADDDPDDLLIMREALQLIDHSHHVIELINGREVLNYLNAGHALPCLIILDNNMPVLSGIDTLVQIKKQESFKNIPVIIFTTSNSEQDRKFCLQHGAKMYTKPHTLDGFKSILLELLMHCGDTEQKVA